MTTTKKVGRPARTTEVAEAIDPSLDQDKINGALVQMRADAQEEEVSLAAASQLVGGALMARLHSQFSAAAEIRMFEQIRDLPRGMLARIPIRRADGTSAMAETLVEFCPLVFGKPYNTMEEAARSLQALGEQTYEVASTLGLNRSALRAARALPPEQLEVVRKAIGDGSSKAEVLSVIEDLATKAEQATQDAAEARAELEAKDHLLTDKNKKIDQLKAAQRRIDKLPADEQLAALQKEATAILNDARGAIIGGLRQAVIAVRNHGDEDHTVFLAGLVGQVQADLSALREEFGLPDTSAAAQQELASEVAQWATKR